MVPTSTRRQLKYVSSFTLNDPKLTLVEVVKYRLTDSDPSARIFFYYVFLLGRRGQHENTLLTSAFMYLYLYFLLIKKRVCGCVRLVTCCCMWPPGTRKSIQGCNKDSAEWQGEHVWSWLGMSSAATQRYRVSFYLHIIISYPLDMYQCLRCH